MEPATSPSPSSLHSFCRLRCYFTNPESREQSGRVATLWFLYQTISHKKSFPSECKLPEAARSCPPSPRSSRRDQAAVITAELQQPDCNNSMDAGVSSQRNFFQLSREHRNKDLIENMPEITKMSIFISPRACLERARLMSGGRQV